MKELLKTICIACCIIAVANQANAQKANVVIEKTETIVTEANVPANTVRDFQQQNIDARDVQWIKTDDKTFEVRFTDGDGDVQGIRYSPYGTERRYYIDPKFCPSTIKDTISKGYSDYHITQIWSSVIHRKSTYKVRIAKSSGILFWKKENDVRFLTFDLNGTLKEEKL